MVNYENLYHILFNAATDAETLLQGGAPELALEILRRAQLLTEELYISAAL